jgi:enterochelin esterase-like enzyme
MEWIVRQEFLYSDFLKRQVTIDVYLPPSRDPGRELLIFNDGQLLASMQLKAFLEQASNSGEVLPPFIAGVHAGEDRKQEYGTAGIPDFAGRGSRASEYTCFILEELFPWLENLFGIKTFPQKSFAGFSLGGLSALDIVWKHPEVFSKVAVFSGSLWWRTRDLDQGYVEARDRIMHQQIRSGSYVPGLKFFLECGTADETMDRNGIGIIDAVNDTEDLIHELEEKGYRRPEDIHYILVADGNHHEATWATVLPDFFCWGWKKIP